MKCVRRILACLSLLALVGAFVVPSSTAAAHLGWIARIQLVPAILAGSIAVLAALAVSVALFGRLYCSVVCPLGIAQDLFRGLARLCRVPAVRFGGGRILPVVRLAFLFAFIALCFAGLTGIVEPYGIFGRFLAAGVMRFGEPAVLVTVWSVGIFGAIAVTAAFLPRFWCNAVCPVGTFLGLFSRFALFRVRIDAAKCVKCGLCVRQCEKGALSLRADRSVAVDASRCVACCDCAGVCRKGALAATPRV